MALGILLLDVHVVCILFPGKSVDVAGIVAIAGPELAIGAAEEEEELVPGVSCASGGNSKTLSPLDIVRPALHLQEELLVVSLAWNGALDAPGLHDALTLCPRCVYRPGCRGQAIPQSSSWTSTYT